ncbi:hypothetical protein HN587_05530 [Candidatus Woesearchaeota archaeon]|jgi:digeranylgeranylglycerophospholipid reductase|nr:hypothetical protein [Candidatus Woesearchaeota archaeon]
MSKNRNTPKLTILIIGAGPIGSHTGFELAKIYKQTKIPTQIYLYDKKKKIGSPIQCTGIITKDIKKYINYNELKQKKIIVNELKQLKVIAPNGKYILLKTKDIVINREKFDQHLFLQAKNNGVKTFLEHKLISINKQKKEANFLNNGKTKKQKYDILIGCDGPNSIVAKTIGVKYQYWVGVQEVCKIITPPAKKNQNLIQNFDHTTYEVYLGTKYSGFFGWQVPESKNTTIIGVASQKNIKEKFKKLKEELQKNNNYKKIETQGGLIPIYDPKQKISDSHAGIFLIGDSAGQVKATTGGGIIPGLIASNSFVKSVKYNKTDLKKLNLQYNKNLRNLNFKLRLHLTIRQILNKFNNEDYNLLILQFNNPKIKKLLREETRDNPLKLICKILIFNPSLLRFINKLF